MIFLKTTTLSYIFTTFTYAQDDYFILNYCDAIVYHDIQQKSTLIKQTVKGTRTYFVVLAIKLNLYTFTLFITF